MKFEIKYKENRKEYIKIIEGKTMDICSKKYRAMRKKICAKEKNITVTEL